MIAKQGDRIQWSFESDHPFKAVAGKTFEANVVIVNKIDQTYGVYADYGQDLIPFDQAKIIKHPK